MTTTMPIVGRRLVEAVTQPFRRDRAAPVGGPAGLRYADLDVWRGVACLMVIVFHTSFDAADRDLVDAWRQGLVTGSTGGVTLSWADWLLAACDQFWVGVPLFFVISGYCITASADRTVTRRRTVREFVCRRLVRIYPPLWLYLAGVFCVIAVLNGAWPWLLDDPAHPVPGIREFSWWQIGGSLTLTETWRHHLVGDGRMPLLLHLWTLCYEEQFYLVTAAVMLVFGRRLALGLGLVTAATVAVMGATMLGTAGGRATVEGFFFDGHWLHFAAGIAVYYAAKTGSRRVTAGLVGVLLAGIALHVKDMPERFYEDGTFAQASMVAYGFAILLIGLHRFDGGLSKCPALVPIGSCGRMCYSLYLTHWPVTKVVSQAAESCGLNDSLSTLAVTMPVSILASLIVGTGFYYLVERHCLPGPGVDPPTEVASGLTSFQTVPR